MMKIDIYKNGTFTRLHDIARVILQSCRDLELVTTHGVIIYFHPEEYDWFEVLPQ